MSEKRGENHASSLFLQNTTLWIVRHRLWTKMFTFDKTVLKYWHYLKTFVSSTLLVCSRLAPCSFSYDSFRIYTALPFPTCKWVQTCWSSATWCGEGFWSHPVSKNCTSWPPHFSTVQESHWKAWQCCRSPSTSVWPPAHCCCSAHLLSSLRSRKGAASQGYATYSSWPSLGQTCSLYSTFSSNSDSPRDIWCGARRLV